MWPVAVEMTPMEVELRVSTTTAILVPSGDSATSPAPRSWNESGISGAGLPDWSSRSS